MHARTSHLLRQTVQSSCTRLAYQHQIRKASTDMAAATKLKLYTNHGCPFAHRAHIALKELNLPYDEVIIPLDRPREQWYLDINPRGLVPTIQVSEGSLKDEIVTESAVVAQFLADLQPSHLLPQADSKHDLKAALLRARINFFLDTWNGKVASLFFPALMASGDEQERKTKEWVAVIEKEIEPLLKDAAPFFGGSKDLTLVEVNVASFLLRFYAFSKHGLFPKSFGEDMDKLPNFSKWAKAAMAKESVTYIWDEEAVCKMMASRIEQLKAQKK